MTPSVDAALIMELHFITKPGCKETTNSNTCVVNNKGFLVYSCCEMVHK